MKSTKLPLDGITVIDASTILAGPLACQILGDYGAEVIKIEHPQAGDPMRGHGPAKNDVPLWWAEIGRNKETLGIYLGDPQGSEILRRLVRKADVLVENFRPGTLERWGLGWDVLHGINPGLILVRITGWGQRGPYAHRPGFGTLAEAMSGFAHLTGQPDGPPTLPAFGLADSICGITASSLTMIALYHRDARNGEGQQIDLSILEPMMTAVGPGPTIFDQLGEVQQRTGNRSSNNAPRNLYKTGDGRWVAVSTSADAVAARVMELIGHPEVVDEPWFSSGRGRVAHVEMLDGWLSDWVIERTCEEVIKAFDDAGAAAVAVYSAADVLEDPHVRASEMIVPVEDPSLGTIKMHNVLGRLSSTPGRIRFTGRALGQDTEARLGRVGYSPEEIEDLRRAGVIS